MSGDGIAPYRFVVPRDWCDYNRHLNDGYFLVAFSTAADVVLEAVGLGAGYRACGEFSAYTVDAHVRYRKEGKAGDALAIEQEILDYDARRLLVAQEMKRGAELLAACECLYVHVDTRGPKAAPFPPEIFRRIAALKAACDARAGISPAPVPGALLQARR
jgi:acyl-CoA thioester hydrolase